MPLLPPNVSYRPDNTPLFVPAGGAAPVPAIVTAQAFVATGSAAPLAGNFTANIAPGSNGLRIQNYATGLARWGIGVDGAETGANAGSEFTINRYDDTGALLQVPLSIQRSTGILTTMGNTTIGDGSAVGGAVLNVNGNLGPSRVYDVTYNPPPAAPTSANRVAYASFVPDTITVNPNNAFCVLNNVTMPGFTSIVTNASVNIIQLFAQFGIETTAAVPKLSFGLQFIDNAGGNSPFVTGTTCLGPGVLSGATTITVPFESAYTLYANLVRGVHFSAGTTVINVSFSASTTPSGAVITLLNNDEDGATPTSPPIVVSALGMV